MGNLSVSGKRVVLTGTFSGLRREDAETALEGLGAIVSGSVSKTTDILFAAADAGSKRAKAESLGVTIHDEAALLRLLGAPKPSKATAPSAKPAKPAAKSTAKKSAAAPKATTTSSTSTAAAGLADELRAFVAALKKRKDLVVEVADVRKPARARDITNAELPPDLAAFYAVTNGAEIRWRFAEGAGGGSMRILALGESGFVDEEESGMGFGRGKEAYLFDEATSEAGAWIVRKKGSNESKLVYASAAEGASGITPAPTVAAYVRKALAYGLVPNWPRVEAPRKGISTAAEELAIDRFRGAPSAAGTVAVGARVSFETFNERGRGEVRALREKGPLVRVLVDDGREVWLDREHVMALAGTDDYEALRANGLDREGTVVARGERLVRALGAGSTNTFCALGSLPSSSFRAAGILRNTAFPAAVDSVLAFWEAIRGIVPAKGDDALPAIGKPATRALTEAGYGRLSLLDRSVLPSLLDLHGVGAKAVRILEEALPPATDTTKARPLSGKGAAFAVEVRGVKTFTLEEPLRALLGGLVHLAFQESATTKKAGNKLVPAASVARLDRLIRGTRGAEKEVARSLRGALGSAKVLPHPIAKLDNRTNGWHGLPKTEGVGLPEWISDAPLFPFRD